MGTGADPLSPHVGRELGRRRCAGSVVLLVHSLPPVSHVLEKKRAGLQLGTIYL